MDFDCTDYNSENCPKGITLTRKVQGETLDIVSMACWGVYCMDGPVEIISWKEIDSKEDLLDRILSNTLKIPQKKVSKLSLQEREDMLKNIEEKSGVNILDIFDRTVDIFGQKSVAEGLRRYTNDNKVSAVFIAGDNVYNYKFPKQALIDLVKNAYESKGKFPSKKQYKQDHTISGQDIDRQLSDGFLQCFEDIHTEDFFIATGNHDVQNCYDLNQQLNFHRDVYKLPGMYYNVVYTSTGSDFSVNFVVLDTNMFSEKSTCNPKIPYDEKDIQNQTDWVIQTLQEAKATWNILIGHVPMLANGHKEKEKKIVNPGLEKLFDEVLNRGIPIHLYACGDEHNQQFLYDKSRKLSLVVAGSGGTALDYDIQKGFPQETLYINAVFGFVGYNFSAEKISVKYYSCDQTETRETFGIDIFQDGRVTSEGNKAE